MAEAKSPSHYKLHAGVTTPLGVADEGQIVRAEDMTPGGVEFNPMTVEEQQAHFGRILYEPHEPEEGETVVGEGPSSPPPPGDSPIVPAEQNDEQREAELPGVTVEEKPKSRATSTTPSAPTHQAAPAHETPRRRE